MNFRIILTQFYTNFSRQEHQIKLSWVAYTPFHFSFTVPLTLYLFVQVEMLQDKVGEKDVIIKTSYTLETLGIPHRDPKIASFHEKIIGILPITS